MPLGCSTENMGITIKQSIVANKQTLWQEDTPLKHPLPQSCSCCCNFNVVGEMIIGSPLTILVTLTGKALLNFHHTPCILPSCLTSYEILLLTVPHLTVCHPNSFIPAAFLPSPATETTHVCSTLTDHPLTTYNNLLENPLNNASFSEFTDGSHFKDGSGKCYADYAASTLFK